MDFSPRSICFWSLLTGWKIGTVAFPSPQSLHLIFHFQCRGYDKAWHANRVKSVLGTRQDTSPDHLLVWQGQLPHRFDCFHNFGVVDGDWQGSDDTCVLAPLQHKDAAVRETAHLLHLSQWSESERVKSETFLHLQKMTERVPLCKQQDTAEKMYWTLKMVRLSVF